MPIGLTWYQLVYGEAFHLPVELESNPNGQSRGGGRISNQPGLEDKCGWLNWMIGGRKTTKTDYGVITLQNNDGNTFKDYGQILNIFLEPELPELEEIDVYELSEQEPSSMVIARP